jgi:hypothetical protein
MPETQTIERQQLEKAAIQFVQRLEIAASMAGCKLCDGMGLHGAQSTPHKQDLFAFPVSMMSVP